MTSDAPVQAPRFARPLFLVNAVVAWLAVALSATLNASGYYLYELDPTKPTLIGNVAGGQDSVLERLIDWIGYFTILSNITVAVVMTVLVVRPGLFTRATVGGAIWRALRLDSVVMIIVTGVVYNLLLATGGKSGWDALSNALLHVIVPILTVLVWAVAGPRRILGFSTIWLSLVLPILWAIYTLIRGAVISAYPYPFFDVISNGYASVLIFVAVILVLAVIINLALLGIDRLIARITPVPTLVIEEDVVVEKV